MRNAIRWTKNRTEAARKMLTWLKESGQTETPDGAAYTLTSIKHAMVGM
ncbi:MAG TPA: hypothetical protein VN679_15345 [Candidatus Acidoferrales bacterium]|nr:hypothetical protein [Candidatus Acidoferrales bacterium]